MQKLPEDFKRISQMIGADSLLIQGAGGNTSIKTGPRKMWVKASGKWLSRCDVEDVFVAVDWTLVNDNIAARTDDPVMGTRLFRGPKGLHPSIETTLHSLMPRKVVFHTHSIQTIAHAVQYDAPDILATKLSGLKWVFVPYSKPGLPLTRLVAGLLASDPCDILIIQNHGLVVGGDNATDTLERMREVEARLALDAQPMAAPDLAPLAQACADTEFVVAGQDVIHQLALSPGRFEQASAGSLYPDHVVFLGSAVKGVGSVEELTDFCRTENTDPLRPKAAMLKGAGVVHEKSLTEGGVEMLTALAQVVRRLPEQANLRVMSTAQEQELIDWDAEQYRQTL